MESIASAQTFYAGEFRHALDEKNRITIPSRWRRKSAEEFILLPDSQNQFLLVMSPEEFARMSGLKGEVALVGGRGRFEIWNVTRWKRAHEEETPTYQHVANVIGL